MFALTRSFALDTLTFLVRNRTGRLAFAAAALFRAFLQSRFIIGFNVFHDASSVSCFGFLSSFFPGQIDAQNAADRAGEQADRQQRQKGAAEGKAAFDERSEQT